MNKPFIPGYRWLFSIVLSLSSPVIYAEVSEQGAGGGSPLTNSVVPAPQEKNAGASSMDITAWKLHAEQWELARSGETILSLPVLKQVVGAWLADKQKVIEIQYPGGEDGEFWVQELTDWLVSLGVPSDNMVTTPGSGADDVIKFKIIKKIK
jgi:hypothetical protein